jgi:hypothetical protein
MAPAAAMAWSSRSNPCTVISGYANAIAILDQPSPHATSATRAPADSRSWTPGIAGSHSWPSRFRKAARLDGDRPSGSQVIGGGAPPVRNASTRSPSRRAARTSSTLVVVPKSRLDASASTGTWPSGSR